MTAPPSLVAQHIARALPDFHRRYPDVTIDIDSSNRLVDLAEEGYDVALRVIRAPPQSMIAKKLADVRMYVVASPQYLEARGTPRTPEELKPHDCLVFSAPPVFDEWIFTRDDREVRVPVHGPFRANTVEPLRYAAMAGLGIVQLPSFQVGVDVQRGRLVRLLPEWRSQSETHLFAVYLPTRYIAPKLRVFVRFLQERFGPEPYWDVGVDPRAAPAA